MTVGRQRVTLDDLLIAIESVTDQIKVLVSAVDDLRCEVEWQSRNAPSTKDLSAPTVPLVAERLDQRRDEPSEETIYFPAAESHDDSLLTAAGRLRAYENVLLKAPRGVWLDEWNEAEELDLVELPVGRVFSVCADLWDAFVNIRPSHVVGAGCDCEEGVGAPYLLASQSETEFLVRELGDEEALRLQELCLAAQAEHADKVARQTEANVQSQLGLF
jgi:hypothetical protein